MLSIISSPVAAGIVYSGSISQTELLQLAGKGEHKVQEHLVRFYGEDPASAAEKIILRCENSGVRIVTVWDASYPALLREIHMPPLVLYCRGGGMHGRHVSIVGTRGSDPVSEDITRRIAASLVSRGITVTSGLALGIDRNAHIGALSAGGATLAVLPQGVDVVTPAANRDIYERILASPGSSAVSELPPGIRSGEPWVFVRRNRIISGISWATVITQAPLKSGAMITAHYALEQNRDLYVCPGNSFDESYGGCHSLIKQGAQIISGLDEFMHDIDPLYEGADAEDAASTEDVQLHTIIKPGAAFEGAEKVVMRAAQKSWAEIDEMARSSSLPIDEINRAVTSLEIAGNIIRRGNRVRAV